MKFFLLLWVALLSSCATHSPQTDALLKRQHGLPKSALIKDVPFVAQTKNHCGPASLAMMLEFAGLEVSIDELSKQMMTPGKGGTFQSDLLTAARRQGMMAIQIDNMNDLLKEISLGNPVLVFQNLAFESMPQWHYAVALGYDLKGPDIILHTGTDKNESDDLRFFERSWNLAGYWALIILPPGKLSSTADDLAHTTAAAGLEQVGKISEAEVAYQAILKKWPQSLASLIGMGNVKYTQNKFNESETHLLKAVEFHSQSALAWHNLAVAQGARKKIRSAKESSAKAWALASPEQRPQFSENLKFWLTPH